MKKYALALVVLIVVAAAAAIVWSRSGTRGFSPPGKRDVYSCSMHPQIVQDHPGKCPICGMTLRKVEQDEPDAEPKKEHRILFYRNPMNPSVTSKTPAKDDMGMDYVPVYEDEAAGSGKSDVEGRSSFSLSKERQQLIGVAVTEVAVRPLRNEIRASGRVAFDPELYTAIEEYRQALISRSQMDKGPLQRQASALIASAKTKLKLMGLSDDQIHKVGAAESEPMNLLLPKGSVWVYAEVFEYELAGLKAGLKVEVETPSAAGSSFLGKISSISPIVNSPSRTVRVRALVPDPKGVLRPDTFVNVRIQVELGEKLAVPETAVLHSNDQDFVFLAKGKGRFEPRSIRVGSKTQQYYEVLSGLHPGDQVVTAANFFIDSESRLRDVIQQAAP